MRHWQPERPRRPPPMERWIFILMVLYCGVFIGYGAYAMLDGNPLIGVLCAAALAGQAAYLWVRIKEAGWP